MSLRILYVCTLIPGFCLAHEVYYVLANVIVPIEGMVSGGMESGSHAV
jgi:hypothetical protein